MTGPTTLPLVPRLLRLALATAALATVFARPAAAHPDLKSSVPRAKSRLTELPRELRLTFTEAPELPLARVRLFGPGRVAVTLGKLSITGEDKATVIAPISGALSAAGTYTVEWEITGEDGHPVDGMFTFTIAPDAVVAAPLPTVAAPPTADSARAAAGSADKAPNAAMPPPTAGRFDAESGAYVIVRFVLYTALLVVIGAVAFEAIVLPLLKRNPRAESAFAADAAFRAASAGWIAAWVLLGACLARFGAQLVAVNGPDTFADPERIGTLMGATRWGRIWMLQLAAAATGLYGFHLARRRSRKPSEVRMGWAIAAPAVLLLAFTPGLVSHAAATPRFGSIPIAFDGLHVIGAAGWLGSLLLVLAAGIPAALALPEDRRKQAVADLINAFSPAALAFAAILALTGLFAAWIHLGGLAPLWQTRYGKILLAKLAVVSIVTLTGAYNWRRVKPALGTAQGVVRLRRSATVEVVVAVIVVLITAMLVATPTPAEM
jgi:copper transport protein